LSDQEQDWITKYRAALAAEQGKKSSSDTLLAALRRIWDALQAWMAPISPVRPFKPVSMTRKTAHREVAPTEEKQSKAS